jgi:hypothetical protein
LGEVLVLVTGFLDLDHFLVVVVEGLRVAVEQGVAVGLTEVVTAFLEVAVP